MTRSEILVVINGERKFLDTYDDQVLDLNFNIADITDMDKSKSSYSKTITLPETGYNREIFGFISDLNASSSFNQNSKARAYILLDSSIAFRGYIQLKSVTQDRDNNFNKLNCVIYADNANLFTNIGEKFLTDLDMSEYNHVWSPASVTASWYNNWESGYYYGMVDYGWDWDLVDYQSSSFNLPQFGITRFYPMTYVKTVFNKILQESGNYTYTSNFLDNSPVFSNLLIDFSRSYPSQLTPVEDYIFRVGMSATQSISSPAIISTVNTTVQLNDENSPNGDPNGVWDTATYKYTANSGNLPQRFGLYIEIDIEDAFVQDGISLYGNIDPILEISLRRSNNPGLPPDPTGYPIAIYNGQPALSISIISQNSPWVFTSLGNGYTRCRAQIYTDALIQAGGILPSGASNALLQPNEELYLNIRTGLAVGTVYPNAYIINDCFLFNEISDNGNGVPAVLNSIIDYDKVLPEKFKQKDFMISIIKMFNLYIEPDPNNQSNFIIEPRDDYYAQGVIEDWSQKLDLKVPIEEDFLSEKQQRNNIFKHKLDKDILNKKYNDTYNQVYGQYFQIFDNDFTKGEKVIETSFSTSPLIKVQSSLQFIIPKIVSDGNNSSNGSLITPHNPRIYLRSEAGLMDLGGDTINFAGATLSSYPYVGHFDNPLEPTIDINFGETEALYYDAINGVQLNGIRGHLYKTYWEKQISEINDRDSRFLKANFWLSPIDIINFRFNKKIFINGQYYRVNKIISYNPSDVNKTTKVELFKVRDITVNDGETLEITSGFVSVGPITKLPYSDFDNVINSKPTVVVGTGNTIGHGSGKSIVNGDSNVVGSPKSFVVGDDNNIPYASPKTKIIGTGNKVDVGVENVTIIGDGYTAHESNRVIISTTLTLNPNKVDAGRDMVINPFQQMKSPNFISASRDCVREIGSYDIVNIVSAGRDSVL